MPARSLFLSLLLAASAAAQGATPASYIITGGAAEPAGMLPDAEPAPLPLVDRIVVRKTERRMYLMNGETVLRSYRVALGLVPEGSKERAGDFRTPEGSYRLTHRNAHSDFFLSVQVSYPNDEDVRRARRNRWPAGGSIMVHGLPNLPRHGPDYYASNDWTDGCIALSNADMVEFWLLSHDNMPIEIMP
jgi:murein L,D-transpeptidase YafK